MKKAECWRIDAFELWCWRRLLDCKEIQPVHPKGNQSWILIGRTDAEAETPVLWPHDEKNWFSIKDPDAGKDWRQEEKGTTDDEMVGWRHWLDGLVFEQALGVGDGQGSLVCCSPWGRKESDTTERLNWTDCPSVQATTYSNVLNKSGEKASLSYSWSSVQFSSFQCSCSAVSDSLRPHGLQQARLPSPSPIAGAYSNSCPSSWWCHPTSSSAILPPSIFPSIRLFPMKSFSFLHQLAKVLEFQHQH